MQRGEAMTRRKFDKVKELLLKQKGEILTEAEKVEHGEIDVISEDLADVADRSSMETGRDFTLRLLDRDRKLLKKIDEAMLRIERNDFGDCEICGEEIDLNRLEARPVATLCIECKEKEETDEKRR